MTLAAGRLRHRVLLEEFVETVNTFGERETNWAPVAALHAAVEPLSGREFLAAQQTQSKVNTRIVVRYHPGVTAAMRFVFRAQLYNIEAILGDKDSGLEYLTCLCATGVNEG